MAFLNIDGKNTYDFAWIVFLAFVGVARRNGCLSSKEEEAKVILHTIRRTKELEFH